MAETAFHPEVDRRAELQEAIAATRHAVLEMGTGPRPALHAFRERYGDNHVYVGWNIDPRQHKNLAETLDTSDKHNTYAVHTNEHFVDGGTNIEEFILPGTLDEVLVSNVFGEPNSHHNYRGHPILNSEGDDYMGGTDFGSKKASLMAVTRLLKPGGALNVVESISPEFAPPLEDMKAVLEQAGLKVMYALDQTNSADQQELFMELSRLGSQRLDAHSYMIFAIKPREEVAEG